MSRFKLRIIRLFLLALLLLPALVGCTRRSANKYDAAQIETSLSFTPDPVRVGMATLEIRLKGEYGEALIGAKLALRGDMTHAGMMPVLTKAEEVQPGTYQASMDWTMAGDWILTIDGTLQDGTVFSRQLDISVSP